MLRHGVVADLAALLAFESRCFGENEGAFNRRQLRGLLTNPRAVWLIEGRFEGAACLLIASNGVSRWGRLYSLSVDPQFRQRGVGRRLLRASFAWFRQQGVPICRAEVKSDNLGARRLYAAMGFKEGRPLPHYYGLGHHAIKLSRPL
ncbi:MAG TPA: GNAT family N-acetyltransferase [Acidiferrobacter sp.]|nr:GNAT family N-acetyltransferase [Acidiferrobacter sp.]